MKRFDTLAAVAALIFSCAGCEKTVVDDNPDNTYRPIELTTKSTEFLKKGKTFTFNYIDMVNGATKKDYVVSPLSMQFLLGMILDGARGNTAAEICKVLGYGAGEVEAVNEYALSMLQQLPGLDKKTTLNIASAIFVDDGWPLLNTYKSDVKKYYDAEISNLNFSDGAAALNAINGWCSKHTNGLIPKILNEVNPNMLAYLLNAIYFKSQWKDKFNKEMTTDETFLYEDGSKGQVKMMKQELKALYTETDVFEAARLPYGNGAFSMVVLLPTKGHGVSDITASLCKCDWDELFSSMLKCEVDLWLPRFETKYSIELNDILAEMGMPSAFDSLRADLKGMSKYALRLSFVKQDAVIKVDEEGTEAAAVSSAGVEKATSVGPGRHVVFHADRPFLYIITESSTGAVLFAGRYGSR